MKEVDDAASPSVCRRHFTLSGRTVFWFVCVLATGPEVQPGAGALHSPCRVRHCFLLKKHKQLNLFGELRF